MEKIVKFADEEILTMQEQLKSTLTIRLKAKFAAQIYSFIFSLILLIPFTIFLVAYYKNFDITSIVIALVIYFAVLAFNLSSIAQMKRISNVLNNGPEKFSEIISGRVHKFRANDDAYLDLIDESGKIQGAGGAMIPILTTGQRELLWDCTTKKRNAFVKITYLTSIRTLVDFEIIEITE